MEVLCAPPFTCVDIIGVIFILFLKPLIIWSCWQDAFAAGTDTPSIGVEWAMSELLRHPKILKKAQVELDVIVGCDRRVHELDIPKLSYIQAIVKESLRLHPPVPLLAPHMSTTATKALGYDIPANSCLIVNIWAIGRDESIWEKPFEFIPEDFLRVITLKQVLIFKDIIMSYFPLDPVEEHVRAWPWPQYSYKCALQTFCTPSIGHPQMVSKLKI